MTKQLQLRDRGPITSSSTNSLLLQQIVSRLVVFFQTMFSDSMIAKKFGCAQTKTVKIITGVLAPYETKCLLENLGEQPFSISTDASNHKAVKLFPLVIRFFNAKLGVQVRLLDMRALPGKSSEMVTEFNEDSLAENGLDVKNLISFCADKAPVNFGGRTQGGINNIFARLKEKVASLVPVGCPAHILHNSAKKSAEGLPFDIGCSIVSNKTLLLMILAEFRVF